MVNLDLTVPSTLAEEIIEFAMHTGITHFRTNGSARRFCNLNSVNSKLTVKVKEFAQECYGTFGIQVRDEPMFGNFIGVNSESGFVHPHKDPRDVNGDYHVRINFLVQKPEIGGVPVIEKVSYPVEERCSWINLASEWTHESTPVVGSKSRIVLSLGSFVNPALIPQFINITRSPP
jgi:hypothetical protein